MVPDLRANPLPCYRSAPEGCPSGLRRRSRKPLGAANDLQDTRVRDANALRTSVSGKE